MNDTEHLNRAIAAHAQWKYRLKQAITSGKSEWTAESVRPDNLCEFGRDILEDIDNHEEFEGLDLLDGLGHVGFRLHGVIADAE